MHPNNANGMADNVASNQTAKELSDLDLHRLLGPTFPNI